MRVAVVIYLAAGVFPARSNEPHKGAQSSARAAVVVFVGVLPLASLFRLTSLLLAPTWLLLPVGATKERGRRERMSCSRRLLPRKSSAFGPAQPSQSHDAASNEILRVTRAATRHRIGTLDAARTRIVGSTGTYLL